MSQKKLQSSEVQEVVSRYDGGRGETISALAEGYGVSRDAIRYHLKAQGAYNSKVNDDAPLNQSDNDLGIGEEESANNVAQMVALLSTPEAQKLIDAAVSARLAQMGGPAVAPTAPAGTEVFATFTETIKHLIEVQAQQQAGYIKPLPADEVDRRAAGLVEMKALLADFERRGTAPKWIVGESGFFECTNAQEFMPGQTIRTYMPPVEDFVPQNREAELVMQAMLQWLGGHTPGIGEQVEAAMRAANGHAPLVTGNLNPATAKPGAVELIDTPLKVSPRKRNAGTIVPERHDVSLAERAAGPQGPVFVGDRAVA